MQKIKDEQNLSKNSDKKNVGGGSKRPPPT